MGRGRRVLLGRFDKVARDACHVAITWASVNAKRLVRWLGTNHPNTDQGPAPSGGGGGSFPGLFTQHEDVIVSTGEMTAEYHGSSLGGGVGDVEGKGFV